jgi:lysophospholipase L1-like esterase
MNYIKLKYPLLAIIAAMAFTACEPEIELDQPSLEAASGQADFSVYVALGNSLTAGYADAALNRQGQIWSYPAILAEKMQTIQPALTFNQPLLPEGIANGTRYIQSFGADGRPVVRTVTDGLSPQQVYAPISGTFQNLGVPGARVGHLTTVGYGSAQGNPYFARFATSPAATVVGMATAQNPTFFTLWIGNNDVLGYALAGGETDEITSPADFEARYRAIVAQLKDANPNIEGALANIPDIGGTPMFNQFPWNGLGPITQQQASLLNAGFEGQLRNQVIRGVITEGARRQIIAVVAPQAVYQQARQGGMSDEQAQAYVQSAEGQAVVNALVTSLTNDRQPEAVSAIVDQNLASEPVQAQINQNYQGALQADASGNLEQAIGAEGVAAVNANQQAQLTQLRSAGFFPNFAEGMNPFIVADETSPTTFRMARETDKILLSGVSNPDVFNPLEGRAILPAAYVLDATEVKQIEDAITAYNNVIRTVATENTFALVDMNTFFDRVVSGGITEGGATFTNAFVSGNAFSLDGVHLTPKGYALVARKFIDEINAYYGSSLPKPNLDRYPAVVFP